MKRGAPFSSKFIIEFIQSRAVEQLGNPLFKGGIKCRGKLFQLANCSLAVSPERAVFFSFRLSIFFLSHYAKITIPNTLEEKAHF